MDCAELPGGCGAAGRHAPMSPRLTALLGNFRRDVDADLGVAPVEYFGDGEIYQHERERVFARSWVFVGHTSEIPASGDYVRRPVGDDDFIIVRDEQGRIHVLLNACTHRGAELTRADVGNTSHFRCPYHNWVFNNRGERVGAPFQALAYKKLDGRQWSLLAAPHVGVVHGLIFANLDAGAASLQDYLGDFSWYLDTVFDLHEDGMEVLGAPQRFLVPADWKAGAENFAGDNYHAPHLHHSMAAVGLADYRSHNAMSRIYLAGAGSGICAASGLISRAHQSDVAKIYQLDRLDAGQRRLHEQSPVITGTVFPNFSFSRIGTAAHPDGPRLPVVTVRSWRPVAAGQMEMWSYHLVWKVLDAELKHQLRRTARVGFGSAGLIEQDDTVAWPGASRAARSVFARKQGMQFNYMMATAGMSDSEVMQDWPGPGVAFSSGLCEAGHRYFHELWLQAMEAAPGAALVPHGPYQRFRTGAPA